VSYPGSGGPWQPNDPNQQQPGGFPQQGGYPQQGSYPQQGGYPQQQGYPQTGPQGFPQTGPQGFPQTGPQGFPQTGPQGFPQAGYPQPKKRGKGPIIGAIAAVLVIAVGAVATVLVLNNDKAPAGEESPTAAATNLVNSLSQGDVLGVLESLAPAESALLVDFNARTTKRLQELEVYDQNADPEKLHGASIEATGLKYDEAGAEKVNDELTITKLIGGKVAFSANLGELPLTDQFMEAAFPDGVNTSPQEETIDIAEVVEESGEPIRIATVNVDGEWYPSLFYTIADYSLQNLDAEWPAEPIADNGADSPEQAVEDLVAAAVNGDLERVIELMPPDEMGALHAVGPVLLERAGTPPSTGVEINDLKTAASEANDLGTKVMLEEVTVTAEGETVHVKKDGDCYSVEAQGETQQLCAADLAAQIGGSDMDPALATALSNLAAGFIKNTGVVTTEVDGKWYVSPLRTYSELGITALSELTPEDVLALVTAGR
jgi:hypothetical protein